jgi:hypothetical protein
LAVILELLREEQGDGQVSKQKNGQNQGNCGDDVGLHGLPQLLAALDVEKRQGEEYDREQLHLASQLPHFHEQAVGEAACSRMILALASFEYRKTFLNKV